MEDNAITDKQILREAEKRVFITIAAKRLRATREELGLSQEALSHMAGYYRTYVGLIETGKVSPSLHAMWRIAHAMDIDLGDLCKDL